MAFKNSMQPESASMDGFHEQCRAEVDTINLFFPGIQSQNIQICFAAWLAFACAMDDAIEAMPPSSGEVALRDSVEIMQGRLVYDARGGCSSP